MNRQSLEIGLNVTLDPRSLNMLTEVIKNAVAEALRAQSAPTEQPFMQAERRLRPHQSPNDVQLPDDAHLLVDTREACKLLKVSSKTLYTMYTKKRMPEPIRLGGNLVRWSLAEITSWVEHGCPPQSDWKYTPSAVTPRD